MKEKFIKNKWFIITIVLVAIFSYGIGHSGTKKLKTNNANLKSEYEKSQNEYKTVNDEYKVVKTDYDNLKNKTECYVAVTDNEKEIVDKKIEEVKQATEEEKAKIKAQQEAEAKAKKEAEEKAKAEKAAAEAAAKAKEEEEAKAKAEAEAQARREAEAHKYETGLTWEDIARDGHVGEYCQFTGKIIQVINGSTYNQYRVKIDDDYNKIMLIQINKSQITSNLLEEDTISFKGKSGGNYTYTTVLGAEQTIPSVAVDEYTLN